MHMTSYISRRAAPFFMYVIYVCVCGQRSGFFNFYMYLPEPYTEKNHVNTAYPLGRSVEPVWGGGGINWCVFIFIFDVSKSPRRPFVWSVDDRQDPTADILVCLSGR